jgi:hypothetical protein
MPHYHLEVEALPEWAPLERLARVTRQSLDLPTLRCEEFMYMGRLAATGRPSIHMYKHIDTRRYLHLDTAGHAFRVASLRARQAGLRVSVDCEPIRDLTNALGACLGLDPTNVDRPQHRRSIRAARLPDRPMIR